MTKGEIYLIPNVISQNTQEETIPNMVRKAILATEVFLVEDLRTARRFISSLNLGLVIDELDFHVLDKRTDFDTCVEYVQWALEGKTLGILSESGCPGIADPGALLVHVAHQFGLTCRPLVGPSSILLALMASGMNGQSFAFHGYLPIDKKERQQRIRDLEKESRAKDQTQIFMDTPYRNEQLLEDILRVAGKNTFLCVARDITGPQEKIITRSVSKWKPGDITLKKIPALFLLYGN